MSRKFIPQQYFTSIINLLNSILSPYVKPNTLNDPLAISALIYACSSHLLAAGTVLGKLLLMASATVEFIPLGQETLRTDWLLTFKADEALLMPHFMLVLDILRP